MADGGAAVSGRCPAAARAGDRRAGARAPRACSSARCIPPTDGRAEPSQAAPAIAEAARAAGATILTECAVRGIETQGGRVSRRGHRERGASPATPWCWRAARGRGCSAAMPAIDLPQLQACWARCSVPRRSAAGRRSPPAARCSHSASGWTAATRSPAQRQRRRHHARFVPAAAAATCRRCSRTTARSACASAAASSRNGARERRWSLDEATPFEAVRVLDPAPKQATLEEARVGAVTQLSRRSHGCRWRRAGAG